MALELMAHLSQTTIATSTLKDRFKEEGAGKLRPFLSMLVS